MSVSMGVGRRRRWRVSALPPKKLSAFIGIAACSVCLLGPSAFPAARQARDQTPVVPVRLGSACHRLHKPQGTRRRGGVGRLTGSQGQGGICSLAKAGAYEFTVLRRLPRARHVL